MFLFFFMNSKGTCLILTSNSKNNTMIPPISSACAWCLEEYSASTRTSRKSLKAIRVERPTQNTNGQERCASKGRPMAAPSPADDSPGKFYGLLKTGMQTKQSFSNLTVTSSGARPEGGDDKCEQPTAQTRACLLPRCS